MSKPRTAGPMFLVSMREHDALLYAAGLSPGKHGLSDILQILKMYKRLEDEVADRGKFEHHIHYIRTFRVEKP